MEISSGHLVDLLQENALQIAILVVLAVLVKILAGHLNGNAKAGFPPGPTPKFLVGNLWDMPKSEDAPNCYMEWGKRYNSDILHATVFGSHFLILNSLEDVEELLERRASRFSDRPYIPVIGMIGWDTVNMTFMSLGDEWREHRRIAQQNFRQAVVSEYYPIQLRKTHQMLQGLLESPERFDYHNKMLSMSVAMSIMYGHDLQSLDDPYIVAADENSTNAFKMMQPGYTLLNILPFLRHIPPWFPGTAARRLADHTKAQIEMLKTSPMQIAKKQIKEGTATPSILTKYLSEDDGESEKIDKNVLGGLGFTVYIGGTDTTISSTMTLFYLLAKHPEVQIKAQKELDSVLGGSRLPDFSDRPSLPYIEAIYRELLRWRAPGLLGVPHCSHNDEIYKGYLIPKGTIVLPNIWAMTRNEDVYSDPHAFKPERFIKADGTLNDDDRVLAYGFGRRLCVGRHLASNSMWITIASILAAFKIGKAKDRNGNDIEIDDEFDDTAIITHKKPFKCLIVPRSESAKELILQANVNN